MELPHCRFNLVWMSLNKEADLSRHSNPWSWVCRAGMLPQYHHLGSLSYWVDSTYIVMASNSTDGCTCSFLLPSTDTAICLTSLPPRVPNEKADLVMDCTCDKSFLIKFSLSRSYTFCRPLTLLKWRNCLSVLTSYLVFLNRANPDLFLVLLLLFSNSI